MTFAKPAHDAADVIDAAISAKIVRKPVDTQTSVDTLRPFPDTERHPVDGNGTIKLALNQREDRHVGC